MWIADFKVWHAGSISIEMSKKFDATLLVVNLNLFKEKGKMMVMRCGYFTGPQAKEFRAAFLVNERRMKIFATDEKQVFFYHPADVAFHTLLFDRSIVFIGPTVTRRGFQYWTVIAPRKQPLVSLFKRVKSLGKKRAVIEFLSLKQGDVNVFSQAVFSQLTALQLRALELACQQGYYSYPRKVNLQQLAKLSGIPRTTLQSHLRKAERTVIPALMDKL